jgi:predicted outer membrane repeat protein
MKFKSHRISRQTFRLAPLCLSLLIPLSAFAYSQSNYPSWWTNRSVITNVPATNDFVAITSGQLKWFATKAYDEFNEHLPGGAGTNLESLISKFSSSNNYYAVTVGQLKYVGSNFYDRLIQQGYTNSYPWTSTTTDDLDYAMANIGQLKNVFYFDISEDSNANGIPDWWESHYFGSPTGCVATADNSGNGYLNIYKYLYGVDPMDASAKPAGTRFVSTSGSSIFPYTNWATAASSIKAALAAATNNYEIVMVADGTYTGYTNGYVSFPTFPVMLTSTGSPENCIIDGCGTNSGFDFQNGQDLDSVLNGFTIRNMRPSDNYAVYCSASPTIENCIMTSNSQCGAILDTGTGTHPVIRSCVINDNDSDWRGGGIRFDSATSRALVENCTIIDNHAAENGGGIYCGSTNIVVKNTILWRNTIGASNVLDQIYGVPLVSNCCVQGGWTNNGTGNISLNPFLVCDYGLSYDSPCIDAGASNGVMRDWKGAARWDDPDHANVGGSVCDIGADEFTSNQFACLVMVSGMVTNSTERTGTIYVVAATSSNIWPSICSITNLTDPGPFTIEVPSNLTCWLGAYCDSNGNGIYDPDEVLGFEASNPVEVTSNITLASDIVLGNSSNWKMPSYPPPMNNHIMETLPWVTVQWAGGDRYAIIPLDSATNAANLQELTVTWSAEDYQNITTGITYCAVGVGWRADDNIRFWSSAQMTPGTEIDMPVAIPISSYCNGYTNYWVEGTNVSTVLGDAGLSAQLYTNSVLCACDTASGTVVKVDFQKPTGSPRPGSRRHVITGTSKAYPQIVLPTTRLPSRVRFCRQLSTMGGRPSPLPPSAR